MSDTSETAEGGAGRRFRPRLGTTCAESIGRTVNRLMATAEQHPVTEDECRAIAGSILVDVRDWQAYDAVQEGKLERALNKGTGAKRRRRRSASPDGDSEAPSDIQPTMAQPKPVVQPQAQMAASAPAPTPVGEKPRKLSKYGKPLGRPPKNRAPISEAPQPQAQMSATSTQAPVTSFRAPRKARATPQAPTQPQAQMSAGASDADRQRQVEILQAQVSALLEAQAHKSGKKKKLPASSLSGRGRRGGSSASA